LLSQGRKDAKKKITPTTRKTKNTTEKNTDKSIKSQTLKENDKVFTLRSNVKQIFIKFFGLGKKKKKQIFFTK
jgi:ATP-dependent Clp protease adapter protein ClpS